MYIPEHFDVTDSTELADLITRYNFGTLVSVIGDRPFATHLPFLYDQPRSRLRAHMARSNPHWEALAGNAQDALIIFQGPHTYISPSWYDAPGVPTWNYISVHVYGSFHIIDNALTHRQILDDLTSKHEENQTDPWIADFESVPAANMIAATIAFEIAIKEIQGKFKLNQNRSATDRAGVIDALANERSDNAIEIAAQMQRLS